MFSTKQEESKTGTKNEDAAERMQIICEVGEFKDDSVLVPHL